MTENSISTEKAYRENLDDIANAALFLAVFVGIWQVIFMLGIWPKISLPSPAMVAESFARIIWNHSLPESISITLARLVGGFAVSMTLGTLIGLAMIRFKGFGKTLNSFSAGLLSFPSIAWVPFAILLIGFNEFGILFVVIMSSIFSIMISTYSSIRNIPPIYLYVYRNMSSKGLAILVNVAITKLIHSIIH